MTESIINIDVDEALNEITQGAVLLDVREIDEWRTAHAPQARHIPLGDLPDVYETLPRDRVIVCVCHLGGRSARAAAFLAEQGFDTRNLDGGMTRWQAEDHEVVTED